GKLAALQLFASGDEGKTWRAVDEIYPDEKASKFSRAFKFEAPRDGLYWFAVRVLKSDGTKEPSDLSSLRTDLKVWIRAEEPSVFFQRIVLDKGTEAVALKLSKERKLPAGVLPGTRVDIVTESSEPSKTSMALRNIKVLAINANEAGEQIV